MVVAPRAEVRRVRGRQTQQAAMLALLDTDTRVPPDHPLRAIRRLADEALVELSPLFDRMYAEVGRPPSIPPEDAPSRRGTREAARWRPPCGMI
jgi:hypothetical protein